MKNKFQRIVALLLALSLTTGVFGNLPALAQTPLAQHSGRLHSLQWPVSSRLITTTFNDPVYYGKLHGLHHNGLDIYEPQGTPIKASANGYVKEQTTSSDTQGTTSNNQTSTANTTPTEISSDLATEVNNALREKFVFTTVGGGKDRTKYGQFKVSYEESNGEGKNVLQYVGGTIPRYGHTMTLLNNGMVLIAGGTNGKMILQSAVLYDPKTRNFTLTGAMNNPRAWHSATMLPKGDVLILGGLTKIPTDFSFNFPKVSKDNSYTLLIDELIEIVKKIERP